jgi:hypothetical protein
MAYVKAETRGCQPEIGLSNSIQLLLASHYLKVSSPTGIFSIKSCGMHVVVHGLGQCINQRVADGSPHTRPCVSAPGYGSVRLRF